MSLTAGTHLGPYEILAPIEQPGSPTARSRITLVENFLDELRRRVPPAK